MRNETIVTIPAGPQFARDTGKRFKLREMPASQAEEWAIRALSAMARGGTEIPDNIIESGWASVAFFGISAMMRADYNDTRPLYAEMMACVSSVQELAPEGRPLMEEDIEEVATRVFLRDEVFKLHANFSFAEILSRAVDTATA